MDRHWALTYDPVKMRTAIAALLASVALCNAVSARVIVTPDRTRRCEDDSNLLLGVSVPPDDSVRWATQPPFVATAQACLFSVAIARRGKTVWTSAGSYLDLLCRTVERLGLPTAEFSSVATELFYEGALRGLPAGRYRVTVRLLAALASGKSSYAVGSTALRIKRCRAPLDD